MCVCRLRLRCLHTSSRSFYDTGMFTFLYSFRCICLPLGEIKLINSSDAFRRRIRTTGLFTAEVNEFTYFVDSVTVNNQVLRVRSSSTSSGPSYLPMKCVSQNQMTSPSSTGALMLRFVASIRRIIFIGCTDITVAAMLSPKRGLCFSPLSVCLSVC